MHPLNPALPSCPTFPSLSSGPAQEQQLPNPAQDSHHPSKMTGIRDLESSWRRRGPSLAPCITLPWPAESLPASVTLLAKRPSFLAIHTSFTSCPPEREV